MPLKVQPTEILTLQNMKNYKQGLLSLIRFKFIYLLFSGIFIVLSCKSALYLPTEAHTSAGISLKELQIGRELYVNRCGSCHTLYLPEQFTPTHWKSTLEVMKPKAKLTSAECNLITKYLNKGRL